MSGYEDWLKECPRCQSNLSNGKFSRLIAIVEKGKDCVVAYKCPDCKGEWPRSIGEIIVCQDPAELKEQPKKENA